MIQLSDSSVKRCLETRKGREVASEVADLVAYELEQLSPKETLTFYRELRKTNLGTTSMSLTVCYRCNQWPCSCSDGITLIHGDCVYCSSDIPKVDVLITDPPYGVDYQSRRGNHRVTNDSGTGMFRTAWHIAKSCLADNRHWYVFGSARPDATKSFLEIIDDVREIIIWDKGDEGTLGDIMYGFSRCVEFIYFGMKGKRRLNVQRPRAIIRQPRCRERLHPTQKPQNVLEHLIELSTDRNEIVFDPFAGSGSTLIAARRLGRKAIGIELEERYCGIAAERLRQMQIVGI